MIAKYWKKIGLLILIIFCLFNVVTKLVYKTPLVAELQSSVKYIQSLQKK